MASHEGYTVDDDLAIPPLLDHGFRVDTIPWDDPHTDWDRYDLVIVRSTWNYQQRVEEFVETLARIEARAPRLENPLPLLRWNLDKKYLRDLEARGVPTIPTLWLDRLEPGALPDLLDELDAAAMVLKPRVGAGAHGAWRLDRDNLHAHAPVIETRYRDAPLMLQPFVDSVIQEGECSLIYFGGEFSHALQKIPKPGDYRSQEEFGSELRPLTPPADLRAAADRALAAAPTDTPPLYPRVDLVRAPDSSPTAPPRWLALELV